MKIPAIWFLLLSASPVTPSDWANGEANVNAFAEIKIHVDRFAVPLTLRTFCTTSPHMMHVFLRFFCTLYPRPSLNIPFCSAGQHNQTSVQLSVPTRINMWCPLITFSSSCTVSITSGSFFYLQSRSVPSEVSSFRRLNDSTWLLGREQRLGWSMCGSNNRVRVWISCPVHFIASADHPHQSFHHCTIYHVSCIFSVPPSTFFH